MTVNFINMALHNSHVLIVKKRSSPKIGIKSKISNLQSMKFVSQVDLKNIIFISKLVTS